ncbi:hypothetical protein HOY82DRAFT_537438 [Tuber indicum]|nr:hypothetical protein HOY82DRAFT_537438 [Tuber indicum]
MFLDRVFLLRKGFEGAELSWKNGGKRRKKEVFAFFIPFPLLKRRLLYFLFRLSTNEKDLFTREHSELTSYSKEVDINRDLHRRYQELSKHSSSAESSSWFSFTPNLRSELPTSESRLPSMSYQSSVSSIDTMSSFIKITPFNSANTDFIKSVEEYLDDVETAALSWDLTVTSGIMSTTNKSKIRLFRQNLERDGAVWHWWYYVLSEASKKDYGAIVKEFRDRYGVKAS